MDEVLNLFPINGLDRSLHAPVFVGLLFITFFAETLGWTYAGLVVPGYFAAVIISAPATAGLVLVETLLTYAVSFAIGKWLPRTRAWSTAFGRERFFLLVVVSLVVRLAVEANLLPYLTHRYSVAHDRELHSLGLVLVPLLANMFWNAGLLRSLPRVALITALTYLVVDGVLLRYTNFTVSRFEVANESVSLSFLEAPHAQLILVVGALLAARANVLCGWDYNGILVPALLSVAWYQPTKLATTIVEALVVYGLAAGLAATPMLSRALIVGTRRVLMVFTIGFVLKWAGGWLALHYAPNVHMIDYLGFGYLLPTLLAVKMWNRSAVGPIIVPTIQVSVTAFIVGNALGYAMAYVDRETVAEHGGSEIAATEKTAAMVLLGAATAPQPDPVRAKRMQAERLTLRMAQLTLNGQSIGGQLVSDATTAGLALSTTPNFLVAAPKSGDPDGDLVAPRVAIHLRSAKKAPWLVVVRTSEVGSPLVPVGQAVAERLNARAFALLSVAGPSVDSDREFIKRLASSLRIEHLIIIEPGAFDTLLVIGSLPGTLSPSSLQGVLGTAPRLKFASAAASSSPLAHAARLQLSDHTARAAGATQLQAPALQTGRGPVSQLYHDRLRELTDVIPGRFRNPSVQDLRLFKSAILPSFRALGPHSTPDSYLRALADQLNYRILRIDDHQEATVGWMLYEPPGPQRRGQATWIRRVGSTHTPGSALLLETPAIRWEAGTLKAGQMLTRALAADGLLLPGAAPSADPNGAADMRRASSIRSYYHLIHQAWLDHGGVAVVLHGISAEHQSSHQAVLSDGSEATTVQTLPEWTRPLRRFLTRNAIPLRVFDGSYELAHFEGSADPALGYSRRFAPGKTLLLWLSPSLRRRLLGIQEDATTARRLAAAHVPILATSLLTHVATTMGCDDKVPRVSPGCPPAEKLRSCDPRDVAAQFELYANTRNPHALLKAVRDNTCNTRVVEDQDSGLLWGVASGPDRTCLVPLLGGPAERVAAPGKPEELADVTSTGLSSLCLENPP